MPLRRAAIPSGAQNGRMMAAVLPLGPAHGSPPASPRGRPQPASARSGPLWRMTSPRPGSPPRPAGRSARCGAGSPSTDRMASRFAAAAARAVRWWAGASVPIDVVRYPGRASDGRRLAGGPARPGHPLRRDPHRGRGGEVGWDRGSRSATRWAFHACNVGEGRLGKPDLHWLASHEPRAPGR